VPHLLPMPYHAVSPIKHPRMPIADAFANGSPPSRKNACGNQSRHSGKRSVELFRRNPGKQHKVAMFGDFGEAVTDKVHVILWAPWNSTGGI